MSPEWRGIAGVLTLETTVSIDAIVPGQVYRVDDELCVVTRSLTSSQLGGARLLEVPQVRLEAPRVELELAQRILLPRLGEGLEQRVEDGVEVGVRRRGLRVVAGLVIRVVHVQKLFSLVTDLL